MVAAAQIRSDSADRSEGRMERLKPIKELLSEEVTYGEIRLVAVRQKFEAVR
jgi:hypothetical protein